MYMYKCVSITRIPLLYVRNISLSSRPPSQLVFPQTVKVLATYPFNDAGQTQGEIVARPWDRQSVDGR
eukprot:4960647-Pleurochrysis_carterae.AAC.4